MDDPGCHSLEVADTAAQDMEVWLVVDRNRLANCSVPDNGRARSVHEISRGDKLHFDHDYPYDEILGSSRDLDETGHPFYDHRVDRVHDLAAAIVRNRPKKLEYN